MTSSPHIVALVVAAGSGARVGGALPKQYQPVGGKALLRYSVEALLAHPAIAAVQVVIHPDYADLYAQAFAQARPKLLPPISGGAERADSVRAGLASLAPRHPDYVLIHDAARPFLSATMIDALVAKLAPGRAVLPAMEVADTVRRLTDSGWEEVSRTGLMRVQTPQGFDYAALVSLGENGIRDSALGSRKPSPLAGEGGMGGRSCVRELSAAPSPQPSPARGEGATEPSPTTQSPIPNPGSPTDEAALWLAAGMPLDYVEGAEELRKVTTPADVAWAEKQAGARRVAVGAGYDVHALMPAGEAGVMRLGGIDIPSAHKLHGHSDADVVLHAVVDALLGALAEGDIGSHFPPSDDRWRGADSSLFVAEALRLVRGRGGEISHLDITIIAERPKISPHRDGMRAAIAAMLALPLNHVSVKATTTEKLGFTGREEGIAAHATATLLLPHA